MAFSRWTISGKGNMDNIVPKYWHVVQGRVQKFLHCPTDGRACDPQGVDTKEIVAQNLAALMEHARDTGNPQRASVKGLAGLAGVGRYTIDGMLDGIRNTGIETLQKVAEVFEIQAWTLLVPHLDPSNPPTRPMSKTEVQLYKRLNKVAREYEKFQRVQRDQENTASPPDHDRDEQGTGSGGKGRSPADE